MIIYVDIDETICHYGDKVRSGPTDYNDAKPYYDRIEKINSLFKNFDTMSFLDLVINYESLLNNGYNKPFLNQSLHTMLSMPFFLFLMTSLAAILTMNTLKKSENIKYIIIRTKLF